GSATLGEVLGALAEMLYGSYFGAAVLVSGLVQGVGSEVGFLATRYKRYDTFSLFLSAVGITLFSFAYKYFQAGYEAFSVSMILAILLVRFISVFFFGVICVKLILNIVNKVQNSGSK
uniref:ECF transporter S component n=1 Tax=uncultured Gemella sp. TaxID=254352 RepID=UPI0028D55827